MTHIRTLTPNILLAGYARGIFPMANADDKIYWYEPDPRAIFPLDTFHVPRRLLRTIKQKPYEIRFNTAFEQVITACAAPNRNGGWINAEIIEAYTLLHYFEHAHSVEAWLDGKLVGGLYGVSLRGLFAGESMFSHATDASKICLVYLVERLRRQGFALLDTQYATSHLAQFGLEEVSRSQYARLLIQALQISASF